MRTLKWIIGFALLPAVYAALRTLVDLVLAIRPESVSEVPLGAWALLGGFAFWIVLFMAMPRPVRTYILAHELTHALWGALMGARVSRLKVSANGGSVQLSKTNFLITLAPYFFPFYTAVVIVLYYVLLIFVDLHRYEPFWLSLIGLSWGFHVTFTISTLAQHQTDISENGYLFSYAVIILFNTLILCLGIVIVASPTLFDLEQGITTHLGALWEAAAGLVTR